jgi:hypothetical protein
MLSNLSDDKIVATSMNMYYELFVKAQIWFVSMQLCTSVRLCTPAPYDVIMSALLSHMDTECHIGNKMSAFSHTFIFLHGIAM